VENGEEGCEENGCGERLWRTARTGAISSLVRGDKQGGNVFLLPGAIR